MSNVTNKREYLVEVNNLKQYFPVKTGFYEKYTSESSRRRIL